MFNKVFERFYLTNVYGFLMTVFFCQVGNLKHEVDGDTTKYLNYALLSTSIQAHLYESIMIKK